MRTNDILPDLVVEVIHISAVFCVLWAYDYRNRYLASGKSARRFYYCHRMLKMRSDADDALLDRSTIVEVLFAVIRN